MRKRSTRQMRLIIFFGGLVLVPVVTLMVIQLARGYRPDLANRTLRPTGLLVGRSTPNNAQIFVDSRLVGTTNTTINLDPGTYDVKITRNSFHSWQKKLIVEKELVTTADALLFPSNIIPIPEDQLLVATASASPDRTRLAMIASQPQTPSPTNPLPTRVPTPTPTPLPIVYSLDLSDSPLNLNRSPRPLTSGTGPDLSRGQITWAPDSSELLIRIPRSQNCVDLDRLLNPCPILAAYLLQSDERVNTPQNVTTTYRQILSQWLLESRIRQEVSLSKIPKNLQPVISSSSANLKFSPDDTKVFYLATDSATLFPQLIPPFPKTTLTEDVREIASGSSYVYDTKEDRNFLVTDPPARLEWFSSSRHFYHVGENLISVFEHDSSNLINLFEGPIVGEKVFPTTAGHRIYLLLDTDSDQSTLPGLYYLQIRL